MAISHLTYIKDASGLAQAKGLPSLIYHEPAIEVKFMRWAAGTTRILTIREFPMDPRCSPGWVLGNHLENQFPNLLRRLFPSNLPPDSRN